MKKADQRNLDPTAPAIVAMTLWGYAYCQQNGGSMDFWDNLRPGDKKHCRELAEKIRKAKMDE